MAKKSLRNLESLIPNGFRSQTVNGTGHATGEGWNKTWDYERPQLPPDETRPAGRSNRTAE